MDLSNDDLVRTFVRRTIDSHKEIDFTSKSFTIQINGLPEASEFNSSYSDAKEELKEKVNGIIDSVFSDLEQNRCCCLIL